MCHGKNFRNMVEPKKGLGVRLDIRQKIKGIFAHFPNKDAYVINMPP